MDRRKSRGNRTNNFKYYFELNLSESMKRIVLFRHGKSLWETGVSDFERDVSFIGEERTEKAAKELLKQLDFKIDVCYSSPAKRARNTAEMAMDQFPQPLEINYDESLYTFAFFDLLRFVKNLDNSYDSAIFFGHNEAYTEFVNRMGDEYLKNLPTSGVAILEFNTDNWQEIDKGKTITIIKPKKL